MFDFKIIFVAGVHGVGKGYLCSEAENVLGLPTFSASKLIKQTKKSEIDSNKIVIGAEENQAHLITALKNIKTTSKTIILDGHFCLLSDKGIINIPIEVFENIPLRVVFVLHDFPENIHQRIRKRDGEYLSVDVISQLQKKEIKQAELISNLIKVPFEIISSSRIADAIEKMRDLSF